ncbi:MAG: homocysteine S-methyltransferase family protein, partial [Spirochaetota bacterium]
MNKNDLLLFDGAFGTYYHHLAKSEEPCEKAVLTDPQTVLQIHKEYIAAGSTAIKTDSFGINSPAYPDEKEREQLIFHAFRLASEAAAGSETLVFADIGYIFSTDDISAHDYISTADLFLKSGAHNFIFETCAEYDILVPAVDYILSLISDAKIIVSFAVSQDGYTRSGKYYAELMNKAAAHPGITSVGLNCACGPSHMRRLLSSLEIPGERLAAMPNAGYPEIIGGRSVFRDNAGYFAGIMQDIAALGIKTIGGCCGTTPLHIRKTCDRIGKTSQTVPENKPASVSSAYPQSEARLLADISLQKNKIIAVEIDPPADADAGFLLSSARLIRLAGADIITIADSPLARTRADSIMLAAKVKRETGAEVMPHLSCRDRNHIAVKGA